MNSKRKGSSFEREIAKKLSFWICKEPKKLIFWRTPSSGAVGTFQKQKNVSGDIVVYESEYSWWNDYFNIECKVGYDKKDLSDVIIDKKKSKILKEFWKQTNVEKKIPLLIIKKNRKILIGINKFLFEKLNLKLNYIHYHFDNEDIYFFELDVFLNEVKVDDLKKIVLEK